MTLWMTFWIFSHKFQFLFLQLLNLKSQMSYVWKYFLPLTTSSASCLPYSMSMSHFFTPKLLTINRRSFKNSLSSSLTLKQLSLVIFLQTKIYILTSGKFGTMVDLPTNHSPACVLLVDKGRGNLTNGGNGQDMARLMWW